VVHFATTAEINAALWQEPVHVLHLSGHGRPGLLELEREDGNARQVTADQFVTEAVPPGRMPPVIALAACHTDATAAAGDPSFAARLIALGANVVIGTETAVTDVYATRVFTGPTVRWPTTRRWTCSARSPTPVAACSRSCRTRRTKASSAWARWVSGRC
jgi:hypothetical protein